LVRTSRRPSSRLWPLTREAGATAIVHGEEIAKDRPGRKTTLEQKSSKRNNFKSEN